MGDNMTYSVDDIERIVKLMKEHSINSFKSADLELKLYPQLKKPLDEEVLNDFSAAPSGMMDWTRVVIPEIKP